jgi:arabinogalactan endo-1,4-beta-galactosidase
VEGSFNTWKEAVDTIQARTYSAVQDIIQHGRIPEVILLGNEINSSGPITNFNTWDQPAGYIERHAELLAAGARAMRSAGYTGKIGVHIDRSWSGFFKDLRRFNYRDFQVAAVSSYPKWGDEKNTLTEKIQALHTLATDDNLEILIIETAAPYVNKPDGWATQDFDRDQVVEVSPLGQKMHMQRLLELVLAIPGGKGLGVISWGTDLAVGVHEWDHVTWNRAQIDTNFCALPALYAYQEYR